MGYTHLLIHNEVPHTSPDCQKQVQKKSWSNFSWRPNQKIMLINMLVDLLQCTDNKHMHKSHQRWIFTNLHTIKISPCLSGSLPSPHELPQQ